MGKLTDIQVRKEKPREKSFKLSDGDGLYIEIMPNGSKYWRMKYRYGGKEKRLAFGVYPDTSMAQARRRCEDARKLLANGQDPGVVKQEQKLQSLIAATNSFEAVANEWLTKQIDWTPSNREKIESMLKRDLLPWLGARPMSEITPPELLAVLRRIESRGALESAHRARALCGQIFRYAVSTGRAERDQAADLRGALPVVKSKHHAAITDPVKVAALLLAIDDYQGTLIVRCAFRLAPLVFVRPGELRQAEWKEIDLENSLWTIPALRSDTEDGRRVTAMKMGVPHIVPLSHQAVTILKELYPLTGSGRFVFPSARGQSRPMSENAIRVALRAIGYGNEDMTPHGFRAMASTILDNMGYDPKLLERQLAHDEPNAVKAAYKRELWRMYLPERTAMMQAWSDYLDSLKAGAKVIPLRANSTR